MCVEFEKVIQAKLESIYRKDSDGEYIIEKRIKGQPHYCNKAPLPFFPADNESADCVISYNIHPVFMNNSKHSHRFFELMFMLRGSCRQRINDTFNIVMKQGDLCLLNMQSTHEVEISGKDDVMINILISPRIFERCFSNIIYDSNFITEFVISSLYYERQKNSFMLFEKNKYTPQITRQVQSMVTEISQREDCYDKVLENQLAILFSYMVRAYHSNITAQKSDGSGSNFQQVLAYINDNYASITLAQLAEHFHYNKSHLSSMIKKHTGNSFSFLINEYRLKKACVLLVNSSLSIDEICEKAGYYDHSHLYKVFKERYSMTPSQYRNTNNVM